MGKSVVQTSIHGLTVIIPFKTVLFDGQMSWVLSWRTRITRASIS